MLERERWEIDGSKSKLAFALRHLVIAEIKGQFKDWGGALLLDRAHPGRSFLEIWIDLASVDTDSAERDAHLRSAEFLDVARFPLAVFRSTGIALRADGDAVVSGRLDLHGITRHVELTVVSQETWGRDAGSLRAGYTARGELDRQGFGLHWNQDLDVGGFVLGDKVELTAQVELLRTAEIIRPSDGDGAAAGAG